MSSADTITKIALAGVGLLSVGTAALVFDVTAGRTAGIIAGGVLLAVLLFLLVYVPLRLHRRARKGCGQDVQLSLDSQHDGTAPRPID